MLAAARSVIAKQKLVAFETQVNGLMLAVAASFSENGVGTWLETEALGYGHFSYKFDKLT